MQEEKNSNPILSRIFRSDPTAARLLKKLYGYGHDEDSNRSTKIATSRVEPKPLMQPKWKNVVSNKDPPLSRFNKAKASAVSVPSFKPLNTSFMFKVDLVPHRKSIEACQQTIEEHLLRNQKYRPPTKSNFRQGSYEDEKLRLGDIFTYKGGNALPIMPSIEPCAMVPCDSIMDAKQRQNSRLSRICGSGLAAEKGSIPESDKRKCDTLKDQILQEIEEREDFQQSHIGELCENLKRKLDEEIHSRMEELRRLV